jgi:lipid-A-disaccharide synthase
MSAANAFEAPETRSGAMTLPVAAPRLALAAGEPSGDLLAASLLAGLRERLPEATQYYGIGGPRMQAQGFAAHWPMEKLSVRGYVEALRHVPEILRIRRDFRHALLAEPPAAFIGVDAPDFNFGLEHGLREAGIPTIHFVCPSIWAWRGGRIKKIAKAVDHMLCVFPFETALLEKSGVAATYVGHPLADEIPLEPDTAGARARLGLPASGPVVTVLPGSRRSEIELIGPTFFAAMTLMQQREPGLRFVMPAATPALRELLQPLVDSHPQLSLTLIEGQAQLAMTAADALLVKSGTVTLEAALLKKPMVISYKVPWLTGQIMQRQGYLPYVGLPNILAGRFVVPELLQHFATPEALADAVLMQLNDDNNRRTLTALFTEMHLSLRRNTAQCAADAVVRVLEARGVRV